MILVLCADVTDGATHRAVEECLDAGSRTRDGRLLVMEPAWSAGLLLERIKPLMPGDLNLASRMPTTTHFRL